MSKTDKPNGRRTVADNRKARFNYEIHETYEAGIALTGTEVKSLRGGKATIGEAYAGPRAKSSSSSTPISRNTCRRTASITRPGARGACSSTSGRSTSSSVRRSAKGSRSSR
jgi:hypothetical protein